MSEGKQIRLPAAAKEFNVGASTLVDYLNAKGFAIENKPTEKLTPEMYDCLVQEYALDKKAKISSEQVAISSGKRKEKPSGSNTDATENPDVAEAPKKEKRKIEVPVELEKASKATKTGKITLPSDEDIEAEKSKLKIDAPTLSGPKVVKTIDLDSLNKPKKASSKKDQANKTEEEADSTTKRRKKATDDQEPVLEKTSKSSKSSKASAASKANTEEETDTTESPIEEEIAAKADPVIENVVERRKLDGLNVLGKIDLPASTDNTTNKRKRKRISIDKSGAGIENRGPKTGTGSSTGNRGGQQRGGGNERNRKPEDRQISASEVQEKLKETLARLSGGKSKSQKSKHRRDKREAMAEKRAADESARENEPLKLTEFITVSELASLMDVNFTEIIAKCMNLGIMVSINQRLDAEVIELVAGEFGYEVEFINLEQEADKEVEEEVDAEEDLESRPPIVTIMGHVDHGKTSLLDNIRNANVVAGEAGGITQHIGAYEVTLPSGKQITFLDTPGHEAFTAMRARGAKITDLAVIVIAADDAVMPQTKEAISHAQAAGTNMIFAINKMDKEGANPTKIYEQLSAMNILVEEWGGKYQSQPIAAKSGTNVDLLLDKILLEAELMNLRANPNRNAVGSVIEASLDKGRGFIATILVQNGTLEVGDMIVAGTTYGRVKAMFNERGGKVEKAGPSTPVQILGLNGAPPAGEKFKVYEDEDEAKEVATHRAQITREQGMRARKHITMKEIGRRLALGNFKQLNVIIKGDVDGSVEALSDSLIKLSTEEIEVRVLLKGVGQIAESDVSLADASDAIIIGFQVRPSVQANKLAEEKNIEIKYYSVIYDAINDIKGAMEGLLEPKIEQKRTCNIEVREVFKITGIGAVAGCFVTDGKMSRNNKINLIRDGIVIYSGELAGLKRYKDDVKEVVSGMECGLSIKNYNDLKQGDIIEGYEEIEVKRTL